MKNIACTYFVLNQLLIETNDRLKNTELYKREFKKHSNWKNDVCQQIIFDLYKRVEGDDGTKDVFDLLVTTLEKLTDLIGEEGIISVMNRLIYVTSLSKEELDKVIEKTLIDEIDL